MSCFYNIILYLLSYGIITFSTLNASNALMSKVYLSKFPQIYNPNVIGGRLFIQGMTYNDDRVIQEWVVGQGISTVADHMIGFFYSNNTDIPVVNQYINTLYIAKGFELLGQPFEIGGTYRHHQDLVNSYLALFLDDFHNRINQSFNVPSKTARYQASVGENKKSVIGNNGEIFWQSLHLYFKHQLLDEWRNEWSPNLSYKLTLRPPLTDNTFDTFGISLSVAMTKIFWNRLYLLMNGSVAYQGLTRSHFDSTDPLLVIHPVIWDLFLGFTLDFGKIGGWSMTLGHRFSSRRIYYIKKEIDQIKPAHIEYIKLAYLNHNKKWEFNVSVQEDLIFPFYVAEPDFMVHGMVLVYDF